MRNAGILVLAVGLACGGSDGGVSRLIGARCVDSIDCDERCLAPSNDFPDRFCTLTCGTIDDCPGSSDCVDLEGGVCLFLCVDDVDCDFVGPSWVCREENLREDQNTKVRVCRGD